MSNTREQQYAFWADLDRAVSRVPGSDYLFVLSDANARTGVRIGDEDCNVIWAYGRGTRVRDSNGTSLLRLRVTTSFLSSTGSSPFPRVARFVNVTQSVDRKLIDNNIT